MRIVTKSYVKVIQPSPEFSPGFVDGVSQLDSLTSSGVAIARLFRRHSQLATNTYSGTGSDNIVR
jgi:hypothetical protein